jgi:plastocyanin
MRVLFNLIPRLVPLAPHIPLISRNTPTISVHFACIRANTRRKRVTMRGKIISSLILMTVITVIALTFAACGTGSQSSSATIMITEDGFATTALTIKAGTSVTFTDVSDGESHFLTTGMHGTHANESGAPSQLTPITGLEIDPGQTIPITFAVPGTYQITCTIHPTMNVTISVHA